MLYGVPGRIVAPEEGGIETGGVSRNTPDGSCSCLVDLKDFYALFGAVFCEGSLRSTKAL